MITRLIVGLFSAWIIGTVLWSILAFFGQVVCEVRFGETERYSSIPNRLGSRIQVIPGKKKEHEKKMEYYDKWLTCSKVFSFIVGGCIVLYILVNGY